MLMTYWSIGKRIVEDEQSRVTRAAYGTKLLKSLSEELTKKYGKGFSQKNLANFRKLYIMFPDKEVLQTRLQNLNWSHFRSLLL